MYSRDFLVLKPFHNCSLCSVCILPQPAFYSQSVVCILHTVCLLPLVCSLQSAVRSLQSAFYADRFNFRPADLAKWQDPYNGLNAKMIEMLLDKQYERGLGREDTAILSSYPLYYSAETKIIFLLMVLMVIKRENIITEMSKKVTT